MVRAAPHYAWLFALYDVDSRQALQGRYNRNRCSWHRAMLAIGTGAQWPGELRLLPTSFEVPGSTDQASAAVVSAPLQGGPEQNL